MVLGFHQGELKVQEKAEVKLPKGFTDKMYRHSIPKAAQSFLSEQPILFMSSIDKFGRMWCSVISGKPGFITLLDERTMLLSEKPVMDDPLIQNISENKSIGLLAMDFKNRRRLRINGNALIREDGFIEVRTEQVYGNCPKYIQTREFNFTEPAQNLKSFNKSSILSKNQRLWIECANTFFIATSDPEANADASHRGGLPGFVRTMSEKQLLLPDYFGNNMFNTLGNIEVNPNTGLLFIDFENGNTLQMTGQANILWDSPLQSYFSGAERLVQFDIHEILEMHGSIQYKSKLVEMSPFNPK